jgi:hypothetical protein
LADGGPEVWGQWYALHRADEWAIARFNDARDRASPLLQAQCWWRLGKPGNALEAMKAQQRESAGDPYLQLCVRTLSQNH